MIGYYRIRDVRRSGEESWEVKGEMREGKGEAGKVEGGERVMKWKGGLE